MDNTQLIVVVLGVIAGLALIVLAYVARTRTGEHAELVAALQAILTPVLATLTEQADKQLALLGPALLPLHGAIETTQLLVDEDDDFMAKLIAGLTSPAAVEAIREALALAEALTDGQAGADLGEGDAVAAEPETAGSVTVRADPPLDAVH